jgi:hypothetical protein
MEELSRATGARIVANPSELAKDELGSAGLVWERQIGRDGMIFVEDFKEPRAVAVFIMGGREHCGWPGGAWAPRFGLGGVGCAGCALVLRASEGKPYVYLCDEVASSRMARMGSCFG